MKISREQAKALGIGHLLPARAPRPKRPPRPEPAILPPGTALVRIDLRMRCVPWSVPYVSRHGAVKDPRLAEFQSTLRTVAAMTRVLREPYGGPVEVSVVARFARGPIGDCTNLIKSIEDSLQGVIFVNDRQVIRNSVERTLSDHDRIIVAVTTAEPTEDDA